MSDNNTTLIVTRKGDLEGMDVGRGIFSTFKNFRSPSLSDY
jgi:hypothetical protein